MDSSSVAGVRVQGHVKGHMEQETEYKSMENILESVPEEKGICDATNLAFLSDDDDDQPSSSFPPSLENSSVSGQRSNETTCVEGLSLSETDSGVARHSVTPSTTPPPVQSTSPKDKRQSTNPRPSPILLSACLPPLAALKSSAGRSNTAPAAYKNEAFELKTTGDREHVINIIQEENIQFPAAAKRRKSSKISLPDTERLGGISREESTCDDQFRLVSKGGHRHIYSKVSHKTRCLKYTRDIFTTMVDMQWKYHLVIWMTSFCFSWIGFGLIWWGVVVAEYPNLSNAAANMTVTNESSSSSSSSSSSPDQPPSDVCLISVQDITAAILFSIETQTTIGYGSRYIGTDCHPLAYILFIFQILAGVCITFFLSGVIYRKLSRPYGRASTILFSRYAVIRKDDTGSNYCFEFRMGDIRKSHVIGTSIRALMVKDRLTSEGERIPLCQYPLQLNTQSGVGDSFIFMPWPVIVSHTIDANSPFWKMTRKKVEEERFEIIVMFEGVVESYGASTQFRTSYLPTDVVWGHRLAVLPVLEKTEWKGETVTSIDFKDFDTTVPIAMDDRSAQQFMNHQRHDEKTCADENKNTEKTEDCSNGTMDDKNKEKNESKLDEEITEAEKIIEAEIVCSRRLSSSSVTMETVVRGDDAIFDQCLKKVQQPPPSYETALALPRRNSTLGKAAGLSAIKPQPTKENEKTNRSLLEDKTIGNDQAMNLKRSQSF